MPSAVLVVDDDAGVRSFLTTLLEDEGYVVAQATDGQPALRQLREHPTGLIVLLDLHMPVVTGFEVLRTVEADPNLRARHAYIVMSARTNALPPDFVQLLERQQIPVFTKPFAHVALLAAVAAAAERLESGKPQPTH